MSDRRKAQTTAGAAVLFPKDCEGPRERADRRSSPQDSSIESRTNFVGGEQPGREFEERRDTENLDDADAVSPTREFDCAVTGQKHAETLWRVEGVVRSLLRRFGKSIER